MQPDQARPAPGVAKGARRAAALYLHWISGDDPSLAAKTVVDVLNDVDAEQEAGDYLAPTYLVCALLNLGVEMTKAATAGSQQIVEAHLREVLADASVDEVTPR